MVDFSEYTGPSADWVALESTLPPAPTDLSAEQLRDLMNKNREELAAKGMNKQGG